MASSTLMSDYIQYGLHANRPGTPNVPAGCSAFYYETDTTNGYLWTGAAWKLITGGTPPSVVQEATPQSSASFDTAVFGSAPTQGNLLIAIYSGSGFPSAGTGWSRVTSTDGSGVNTLIFYKVAGAGESTTQQPLSALNSGVMSCWEITGGAIIGGASGTNGAGTATGSPVFAQSVWNNPSVTLSLLTTGGLVLGQIYQRSNGTDIPNSMTNAVIGSHTAGNSTTCTDFSSSTNLNGTSTTISASFTNTDSIKMTAIHIH